MHPGFVYTGVTRHLPAIVRIAHAAAVPFWILFQKLPRMGAYTTIHACFHERYHAKHLQSRSPFADCEDEAPGLPKFHVELGDALWDVSDTYVLKEMGTVHPSS